MVMWQGAVAAVGGLLSTGAEEMGGGSSRENPRSPAREVIELSPDEVDRATEGGGLDPHPERAVSAAEEEVAGTTGSVAPFVPVIGSADPSVVSASLAVSAVLTRLTTPISLPLMLSSSVAAVRSSLAVVTVCSASAAVASPTTVVLGSKRARGLCGRLIATMVVLGSKRARGPGPIVNAPIPKWRAPIVPMTMKKVLKIQTPRVAAERVAASAGDGATTGSGSAGGRSLATGHPDPDDSMVPHFVAEEVARVRGGLLPARRQFIDATNAKELEMELQLLRGSLSATRRDLLAFGERQREIGAEITYLRSSAQ